jgi:hypothetical protein
MMLDPLYKCVDLSALLVCTRDDVGESNWAFQAFGEMRLLIARIQLEDDARKLKDSQV